MGIRLLSPQGAMRLVVGVVALSMPMLACETPPEPGPPTQTVCPTDSALTWIEFGSGFMTTYCTRCHGSYASHSSVKRDAVAIDRFAGSGPAATNTVMPEDGKRPSVGERAALAEWLSCGAP